MPFTGYIPTTVTSTATTTAYSWYSGNVTNAATTTAYYTSTGTPDYRNWQVVNQMQARDYQAEIAAHQGGLDQQMLGMAQANQSFNEQLIRAAQNVPPPPQMSSLSQVFKPRAKRRAQSLLRSVLTRAQWESFLATKMFEIEGRSGQLYRIHYGRVANIEVPSRGHRLCVHPDPDVPMPVEDVLVAQVLHLRADDVALARRANVHAGLGPLRV